MRPLWERAPQLAGKVHNQNCAGASMVCPASHVATNRGRNIDAAQHKEQHSTCLQFVLDATKRNVHQETKVPRRRWAAENTQPCVLYGNVHLNLQGTLASWCTFRLVASKTNCRQVECCSLCCAEGIPYARSHRGRMAVYSQQPTFSRVPWISWCIVRFAASNTGMQTSSVLLPLFSLRGAVVRGMAIATVARVVSLRRLLVLRLDVVSLSLSPYFAVITLVAVRDTKPWAFTAKRLERAEKLEWMGLPRVFFSAARQVFRV